MGFLTSGTPFGYEYPDVAPDGADTVLILSLFPRLARRGPHDHARFTGFRALLALKLGQQITWLTRVIG
jgi:hypothetical protein